ncbi:MAG: hypothetical protein KKA62_00405 [Nanoarchaeota archaeon]|nr:hypothetical protein [Nanoarchaeota archaeon]MBU1643899.1 hypothetical protein [Nanoarchaeota archaeon]MBU1976397.1 hypothetical protein [Nanoarchaeota archaeon]
MQQLMIDTSREIKTEALTSNLHYLIESLGGYHVDRRPYHLHEKLRDYLKRSIVNQWSIPINVDETKRRTYYSWMESIKKTVAIGSKATPAMKDLGRIYLNGIIDQLELDDLIINLDQCFLETKGWSYELFYGVGRINLYEFKENELIITMTNDLAVFEEFGSPHLPKETYSAKIIFDGFNEYSSEFNILKQALVNNLNRIKLQVRG